MHKSLESLPIFFGEFDVITATKADIFFVCSVMRYLDKLK